MSPQFGAGVAVPFVWVARLRGALGGRMAANVAGLALALGALFALAELSYRFFEQPLLSLKSRFQPGPRAAESLGAGAGPAYDRAPS